MEAVAHVQRPWRCAIYWLVPGGLLRLFSYRAQDSYFRGGNGLGFHLSIINSENGLIFYRLA